MTIQTKARLGIAGVILLAASLACSLVSPTPASWAGTPSAQARAATNTAYAQTQAAAPPVDTPAPSSPTPETPIETLTPSPTLEPDGPWLVYPAPDGGGLRAYDVEAAITIDIHLPKPVIARDLTTGLRPNGAALYIRAGSPLNTDELAIYRVTLPEGEVTVLTPLLSILLQRRIINEQGTRAFDALAAVTAPDGLAWSPDGRYLAFLAALDGDSSDLYIYDTLKEEIERLTGLYSQSQTPFWSPQSNWLLHQELADIEPADPAGITGRSEGVFALRVPSYDDQRTLYLPHPESINEVFLGWANTQTFVSYSATDGFPRSLRLVNIETGEESFVLQRYFEKTAFDPLSGTLALVLGDENAALIGLTAGVYLLPPDRAAFELLRAGIWHTLSWDSGGMFLASGPQGAFAFSPEGEGVLLADEGDLQLSPSGNWFLAWGDGLTTPVGLRLYQSPSGNFMQNITEKQVTRLFWQPDSQAFFLFSEGELFQVRFPGLKLNQIDTGFDADGPLPMVWME
jgi:WD40 repeat protein